MIGETVGNYRVLEQLGEGGMGVVYKARDTRFGRLVALKFLSDKYAANSEAVQRFDREGRAASSLNHSCICALYETGTHQGRPYLAMELLEGETAKDRMQARPFHAAEVVDIGVQMADALEAAHTRGIIHRDIKPSNIFITSRGQSKLLDFGLAKLEHKLETQATAVISLRTRPGTVLGTWAYMSPEQARGEEADPRGDIYSLGVVMFEMFTGVLPVMGAKPKAELPEGLRLVLARAMELDKSQRYQRAAELRDDLRRLKQDPSFRAAAPPPRGAPADGPTEIR